MKMNPVVLAFATVLTACGGGGSGSGDGATPPPSTLTAANYQEVSNAAAAATSDVGSTSALAKIASASDADSAAAPGTDLGSASLILQALSQLKAGPQRETAQAVSSETVACPAGGTAFGTFTDINGNDELDAGDAATFSFTNCAFAAGQPAVSGGMSLKVLALTSSGATITGGKFTVNFNNLASGSASLSGGVGFTFSATEQTLAYDGLTVTRKGKSATYGYTATLRTAGSPYTLSVTGPLVYGGSSYTLTTLTPLSLRGYYPTAGLIRVSDAAGNHADITPAGTQFSVSYYPSGSATASATYTAAWSSIL